MKHYSFGVCLQWNSIYTLKKGSFMCYVNETSKHYGKWNKSDTRGKRYDPTDVRYL